MNLKKAVIVAVILYAIMFLVATVLMFGLKLTGLSFNAPMLIISAIFMFAILRYYYFKNVKVINPLMDGLKVGTVIAIIIFLIEAPVMVYALAQDWSFFTQWNVILGYLLSPVITIIVAYMKK